VWLAHHRPGQLFGQVTQFSVVRLVDGLLRGLHTNTRKMSIIARNQEHILPATTALLVH
jgi:hypothetical protein